MFGKFHGKLCKKHRKFHRESMQELRINVRDALTISQKSFNYFQRNIWKDCCGSLWLSKENSKFFGIISGFVGFRKMHRKHRNTRISLFLHNCEIPGWVIVVWNLMSRVCLNWTPCHITTYIYNVLVSGIQTCRPSMVVWPMSVDHAVTSRLLTSASSRQRQYAYDSRDEWH